jgi:hypothetical protein
LDLLKGQLKGAVSCKYFCWTTKMKK